jgi:hypothetical protein
MLRSQTIIWTAGRDPITIAVKIADALTMFENFCAGLWDLLRIADR